MRGGGLIIAQWYHAEADELSPHPELAAQALCDTWRTTQPLHTLESVCEWIKSHPDAVAYRITFHHD